MQPDISLSEILGTIQDEKLEVCASADAEYDAGKKEVVVALTAFTRCVTNGRHGEHSQQPWLPADDRVREHLPREEAGTFARDVFRSWVKKVRASIPSELTLRT